MVTAWRWPLLVFSAIVVLAGGAVGLSPLLEILHAGWSERYGHFEHGYLVLVLVVWMAVRYWRRSPPQQLAPEWWAIIPLLLCIVGLAFLELVYVNSARLSLLPLMFLAVVTLVFGSAAASRLFWPAIFLYVALPQWWAINGVMQALTTAMVTWIVSWTGVPAFIEGNFVHVPAGTFEIASGCSGLNYLLVGLTLGGFYALMYLERWKHRIVLLTLAAGLALVSNWIRVYSLILIGHLSDMQHYLITVEHHIFGWVLFLVFMVPMLLVARRMEVREQAAKPAATSASGEDSAIRPSGSLARPARQAALRVAPGVVPAALVAAAVLVTPRAFEGGTIELATSSASLPETLAGYPAVDPSSAHWQPVFVNAVTDQEAFDDGQGIIEVYQAAYARQDRDHRLVRAENSFLGEAFTPAVEARHEIETPAGRLSVSVYRGNLAGKERLVWGWYWVAGYVAATPLEAKLAELRGLINRRRDGMAFALSTSCGTDCVSAEDRLAIFLAEIAEELPGSSGGSDHSPGSGSR